jgi:hypothetical protein
MLGAHGHPWGPRSRGARKPLSTHSLARAARMGSMTAPPTPAGCVWGLSMTPRAMCRRVAPSLGVADGLAGVSQRQRAAGDGRGGRQERIPPPLGEGGVARAGRGDRHTPLGVPLATGAKHMAQEGTSHVLAHHGALAWQTAGESRGHCQAHRESQAPHRLNEQGRTGRKRVPDGDQSFG